jgi:hypothetical protein
MRRSLIYPVLGGIFALLWFGYGVHGQPAGATFMCPAQSRDTCMFVVFFGFGNGFETKTFELHGGEAQRFPDVVIGRDAYCYGVNQPVASSCQKLPVSDGVNK